MNRYQLKVCGVTDPKNLSTLNQLSVDYFGMIHYPPSPRHVDIDKMGLLFKELQPEQKAVLVTVNGDSKDLEEILSKFPFTHVQLHGDESPIFVSILKAYCKVIKVLSIADEEDLKKADDFQHADYLLFDTKGKKRGGNGYSFDWNLLDQYQGSVPFFLSGGIGPDDHKKIQDFNHPKCVAVDVNSKFEIAPGVKHSEQVASFQKQLRHDL